LRRRIRKFVQTGNKGLVAFRKEPNRVLQPSLVERRYNLTPSNRPSLWVSWDQPRTHDGLQNFGQDTLKEMVSVSVL
jgi:hypothetical protein